MKEPGLLDYRLSRHHMAATLMHLLLGTVALTFRLSLFQFSYLPAEQHLKSSDGTELLGDQCQPGLERNGYLLNPGLALLGFNVLTVINTQITQTGIQ